MDLIGARLLSVAPGRVEIELPMRNELEQQHGYAHAGAALSIADSAAGYSSQSLMAATYREGKGEGNRQAIHARVRDGVRPPGLIAYRDGAPVGWVSIPPAQSSRAWRNPASLPRSTTGRSGR